MDATPEVGGARTVEQAEGRHWGDPPADATPMVKTVYELRRKPIAAMDTEDLRMLLSQQEGVDVLVPVALTLLERDPLAEGDFYAGDLLTAVLRIPRYYWRQHSDQLRRVSSVLEKLNDLDEHDSLRQQIEVFRAEAS
ncbi:contact-dependent growth inhibition system immunity protein [Amycolatopsis magusensis]|uniref:Uncharacterized protein n=1 Tax=Amycolatopsis magusensis TaxID=882444 RepID=A0ABS4PR25_9PSEU|nr:contact-dependent growth inhibition system immunity protein [Amycolatopsis magusensis]MBP2181768.1 hypothetical protein [Amycolatopsis magusensis]